MERQVSESLTRPGMQMARLPCRSPANAERPISGFGRSSTFSFIHMEVSSGEKQGRHTKTGPGLACASAWATCKIGRLHGCDGKSCRHLPEDMAGASKGPSPLRWWSFLPLELVRSARKTIKQQPRCQRGSFRELIPSLRKKLVKKKNFVSNQGRFKRLRPQKLKIDLRIRF